MEHTANAAQTVQSEPTPEARRHHGGSPWPKGVSGNPSGNKNPKRFAELHTAMLAEFEYTVLTASDRALLEQAARLMARRMRNDENAIKATNAARIIITTLHTRHKRAHRDASASRSWSPLRSSLDEVTRRSGRDRIG
jgi:hypothetical protein